MPFQKGHPPYSFKTFLGKHHSTETRLKISVAHKKNGKKPPSQLGNRWGRGPTTCIDCGNKTKSWYAKRCNKCRVKFQTGENSPKWKGGITPKNMIERQKFYKEIRQKVLERDQYRCQICGTNDKLQVDHIQPWSEYVELRFNISNCRTVCESCHYEITFGKPMSKSITSWGRNNKNWSLI